MVICGNYRQDALDGWSCIGSKYYCCSSSLCNCLLGVIMTVVSMIEEWRKGCGNSKAEGQSCHECSVALIEAIEKRMSGIPQSKTHVLLTKDELDEFMHDWKLER